MNKFDDSINDLSKIQTTAQTKNDNQFSLSPRNLNGIKNID